MTRTLLAALLLVAASVGSAHEASAQGRRTTLTLSGFPLTASTTTTDEFDNGFSALGSTSFTVDLTTNNNASFLNRRTTVSIACAAPCPAGSSNLQWRRADQATWNTLTTTFVTVEERVATFGGANDPWGNTLAWRYLLSWTGSPPTAAQQFRIQMQLITSAP